ncbi:hypothetical protein WDZ92_22160 [Nostoc sp. NIES-2111]
MRLVRGAGREEASLWCGGLRLQPPRKLLGTEASQIVDFIMDDILSSAQILRREVEQKSARGIFEYFDLP